MYAQPMMQQQPMMMAPAPMYAPPPPQAAGPTIITVGGNSGGAGSPCPVCQCETGQIPRKKIGCVTILWCLCLLFFTGTMCCYPFCVDSCKDTELVCVKCHTVKAKIDANCC